MERTMSLTKQKPLAWPRKANAVQNVGARNAQVTWVHGTREWVYDTRPYGTRR